MKRLRLAAPINLGPELFVSIYDDIDTDFVGVLAEIEIDRARYPVFWLHECEGRRCNCVVYSGVQSAKDVSEITDGELDAFIQRMKELAERNGCRFDSSNLSALRDEFHEIKNTS